MKTLRALLLLLASSCVLGCVGSPYLPDDEEVSSKEQEVNVILPPGGISKRPRPVVPGWPVGSGRCPRMVLSGGEVLRANAVSQNVVVRFLQANPTIRTSLMWMTREDGWISFDDWSAEMQCELILSAATAHGGRPRDFPDPPTDVSPDDHRYVVLTLEAARRVFFSLIGSGLALEIRGTVPWSLNDYSPEHRALLMDGRSLFDEYCYDEDYTARHYGEHPYFGCENLGLTYLPTDALPVSPAFAVPFLLENGIIGATRRETIGEFLEWSEQLKHFAGQSSDVVRYYWGFAPAPTRRILEGTDPVGPHPDNGNEFDFAHWTPGCHGTSSVFIEVLRHVNIPVTRMYVHGHRVPHFVSEDLFLSHGDDPYSGLVRSTPQYHRSELLIDREQFEEWFGPVESPYPSNEFIGCQVQTLAIEHLADRLLEARCDDRRWLRRWGPTPKPPPYVKRLLPCIPYEDQIAANLPERLDEKIATFGGCGSLP